jgi:hypothetical protein
MGAEPGPNPQPSSGPMAGTDFVRLQLYAVRALVARELQVTPLEAEKLILEYASRGHFRRCGFRGSYIDPRHWGASHPELGVHVHVDFTRSVVRHILLPATEALRYTTRLALDDALEPYKRSNVEMRKVCLARDDVLSMLRELVPPEWAQADKPLTSEREEKSKSISAPASKSASESQSPKKFTVKGWVSSAVKDYPRPRGEKDYAGYLLERAPQKWSKHSIQNALSELAPRKNPKRKKR